MKPNTLSYHCSLSNSSIYKDVSFENNNNITLTTWAAVVVGVAGVGLGAYKVIKGNSNAKKAKRARERLAKPFYDIQDEYYQNKNLAGSLAQEGLPESTKDYYTQESQRGLSAGIKGVLSGGGNPNDISKLFTAYDDGIGKIGVADAQAHIDNIKYYMNVNKDLAGQKTIQWAVNKQSPYLNTLKQLNAEQFAGKEMANQGISDIASSVTSFATSQAGGSGAGGFGKGSKSTKGGTAGEGGTGAGGSMGSSGGGSGRAFNSYSNVFKDSSNNTNNNTPVEIADPFGNNDKEYKDYLLWKNMQGKI